MNANITMDRLRLRLPAGWHGRETHLVRLIGRELGQLPFERSVECDVLKVPPVQVRAGESDLSLARRVARAIHEQLGREYARNGDTSNPNDRRSHA